MLKSCRKAIAGCYTSCQVKASSVLEKYLFYDQGLNWTLANSQNAYDFDFDFDFVDLWNYEKNIH